MNEFWFGILNADQSTEYNNKYYFKWWEQDCYKAIAIDLWIMYEKILDIWLINANDNTDLKEEELLELTEHKNNCRNYMLNNNYNKFLDTYSEFNKFQTYKFTWEVTEETVG